MTPATLSVGDEMDELIAKLENGSGGDRQLDAEINKHFFPSDYERYHAVYLKKLEEARGNGLTDRDAACWSYGFSGCQHYTTSLDAALSLVEKMLPGAEFSLTNLYGVALAELPLNGDDNTPWETGRHIGVDLPRALLVALLRSLQSRKKD